MATKQHIQPFPDSIDREYFGAWLAGFTDGEGCFCLYTRNNRHGKNRLLLAQLRISVRADDIDILRLIQSYFDCGNLSLHHLAVPSKPFATFDVATISDLHDKILTVYDKYPLLAKKRRDYQIWRDGINLLYKISGRKLWWNGGYNGRPSPRGTDVERLHFMQLVASLRETRQFPSHDIPVLKNPEHTPLLDNLPE